MQICSPDDRIFCAELMKRLHIGTGQRWCKEQIDCCAFSGIEYLVMVDHVRENQRKVTFLHVIEVLPDAEFERSLLTPSRFDRWLRGEDRALSRDELAGYRLFKRHGCIACHQGVNVGGNLYQRFGIMRDPFSGKASTNAADLGRYNVTHKEEDRFVFKVPTLRNIALTAPYFHDGSSRQLDDAVRVMGWAQLGVELPERDVELITLFLGTLTGEAQQ